MNKIEVLAKETAARFGTQNPFKICEQMNIIVITYDLPKSVNGFFIKLKQEQNVIVINKSLNTKQKTKVCAHELCHILIHDDSNSIKMINNYDIRVIEFEKQADYFASCLLFDV